VYVRRCFSFFFLLLFLLDNLLFSCAYITHVLLLLYTGPGNLEADAVSPSDQARTWVTRFCRRLDQHQDHDKQQQQSEYNNNDFLWSTLPLQYVCMSFVSLCSLLLAFFRVVEYRVHMHSIYYLSSLSSEISSCLNGPKAY
jgi:hypothetical protein